MGFSAKQVQALRRQPHSRYIRTREAHGRELTYLEGWYAISEANRIFGLNGWNRETVESRCALARENRGNFLAVYPRPRTGHRTHRRRNHHSGGPRHGRRPRHVARRGVRHRAQGRGNRCHQTGAGDLRKTVRSRALSGRQGGSPETPTLIACRRRACRRLARLSSRRYDPNSTAVPFAARPGSSARYLNLSMRIRTPIMPVPQVPSSLE